jgi:hypothetical protein
MGLTIPYRKKLHVQKYIAEETGWPKRRRHGEKKDIPELKITSWNIRTLYRAGALKELKKECKKYDWDVIAVQKVRWKGKEYLLADIITYIIEVVQINMNMDQRSLLNKN